MKKIAMMAFAALAMVSCGDDDSGAVATDANLTGTWKLTALTTPNAVDGNDDGVASTNLITEGGACFTQSTLVFSANNMLANNLSFPDMGTNCYSATATGSYVANGNSVVTTVSYDGDTEVITYVKDNNKLTVFVADFYEVEVQVGGETFYQSVDATMVYTKQ
jgi:hypothetical protein